MKQRIIAFLLLCGICVALGGCVDSQPITESNADASAESSAAVSPSKGGNSSSEAGGIDVDLTKLSSTMIYSEVYNMMTAPQNYIGKTVKMKGQFSVYHDDTSGNNYFAVVIADATACCQQGLEFILENGAVYPADYPNENTEITVQGVFETYKEGENQYCRLKNAEIVS